MFRRKTPIASFAEVERAERIFYLNYLRENMTVFDVGAYVGDFTMLFSRAVGSAGAVHSFEPLSSSFNRLAKICEAAMMRNVYLNQVAVAEAPGSVVLHLYEDDYLAWTTRADRPLASYGIDVQSISTEKVQAVTIDDYCREKSIETIDLLKLDVEGAELQALQGASAMLKEKQVACVSYEFGQTTFDMGNTPAGIEQFLNSVGYKTRNLISTQPLFPGGSAAQTAQYAMHLAIPEWTSWTSLT